MPYKFTRPDQPAQQMNGLDAAIGGVFLSELGIDLLRVDGRGQMKQALNTQDDEATDGEIFFSRKRKPLDIVLTGQTRERRRGDNLAKLEQLNKLLYEPEQRLVISDDDYYYVVTATDLAMDETAEFPLVTISLRSHSGYKYKDVTQTGLTFTYETELPAIPSMIWVNFDESTSASMFRLIRKRDARGITLTNLSVKSSDVIVIRPQDIFGITKNGVNVISHLEPNSLFENFNLVYRDQLIASPTAANAYMEVRLRRYG